MLCIVSRHIKKALFREVLVGQQNLAINRYINRFPKNKRWIVNLVETISDWYQVNSR